MLQVHRIINIKGSEKNIVIKYEYQAQNLLKSNEESNFAIWKYDNHLQETSIKNASVNFIFEEIMNSEGLVVANKDYFLTKKASSMKNLSWKIDEISKNKTIEFSFKNKKFNNFCENLV